MGIAFEILVCVIAYGAIAFFASPFILNALPNRIGVGVCLILFVGSTLFGIISLLRHHATESLSAPHEPEDAPRRVRATKPAAEQKSSMNRAARQSSRDVDLPPSSAERSLINPQRHQTRFVFKGHQYELTGNVVLDGGRDYLEAKRLNDGRVFKFRPEDVPLAHSP